MQHTIFFNECPRCGASCKINDLIAFGCGAGKCPHCGARMDKPFENMYGEDGPVAHRPKRPRYISIMAGSQYKLSASAIWVRRREQLLQRRREQLLQRRRNARTAAGTENTCKAASNEDACCEDATCDAVLIEVAVS